MNSKDYDRKFWLVVENGNKKIDEFHLNFKGNSFLCYSYFSQEHIAYGVGPGLVYEAVYGAIYVDGEYSINEEPLYDKTTRYFTQDKLNGFLVVPIKSKAINILFENFTRMIDSVYYSDIDSNKPILCQSKKILNVDFNMILAYPEKYISSSASEDNNELSIKNTLVLLAHDVKEKIFKVYLSTGEGRFKYDLDKGIIVKYDKLTNVEKYIKLSASGQKIKIKGKLKYNGSIYEDEGFYYIEATKITIKSKN